MCSGVSSIWIKRWFLVYDCSRLATGFVAITRPWPHVLSGNWARCTSLGRLVSRSNWSYTADFIELVYTINILEYSLVFEKALTFLFLGITILLIVREVFSAIFRMETWFSGRCLSNGNVTGIFLIFGDFWILFIIVVTIIISVLIFVNYEFGSLFFARWQSSLTAQTWFRVSHFIKLNITINNSNKL